MLGMAGVHQYLPNFYLPGGIQEQAGRDFIFVGDYPLPSMLGTFLGVTPLFMGQAHSNANVLGSGAGEQLKERKAVLR